MSRKFNVARSALEDADRILVNGPAKPPSHELSEVLSTAFARADALLLEGTQILAAQLHEAAIGRALISTHQLTLGALAVLDVDRHFERDQQGRIQRIQMSGQEASSPLGIDIPLPVRFAERLKQHSLAFRPLLPGAEHSTKLFPGGNGDDLDIRELRARLRLVELLSHSSTERG
jgi:hypothetical protein